MINTPEQALEFVEGLQLAAMKARSIISEIADGNENLMNMVSDLNPGLFEREGKLDIMKMCSTYIKKAQTTPLNRTDIMGLMAFSERIGPAFMLEVTLRNLDWPDGGSMEFFQKSSLPIM